jgi:hypothetical protein
MSNITDYRFVLYERLASQKLNEILSQLNSHNHGSSGGVAIDVNTAISDGSIAGIKLVNGSVDTLQLADGSVTTPKIANNNVTLAKLGSDIHLSNDGYAVYAP